MGISQTPTLTFIEFDPIEIPSPPEYDDFWNAYNQINDSLPFSYMQEKALKESPIQDIVKLCKKDGCFNSTILTYADLGDGLFKEWLDPENVWGDYCNLCGEE